MNKICIIGSFNRENLIKCAKLVQINLYKYRLNLYEQQDCNNCVCVSVCLCISYVYSVCLIVVNPSRPNYIHQCGGVQKWNCSKWEQFFFNFTDCIGTVTIDFKTLRRYYLYKGRWFMIKACPNLQVRIR